MKKTRRIAAFIAAMAMAATLAVPMSASLTASAAYTVTVGDATTGYDAVTGENTYEAYQIFKGNVSGTAGALKLSDVDWGDNITYSENLINEIKALGANFTSITYDAANAKKVAQDVADALAKESGNDTAVAKAFAEIANKYKTGDAKGSGKTSFNLTDAGYYLIQDAADSPASNGSVATGAVTTPASVTFKDGKALSDANTALEATYADEAALIAAIEADDSLLDSLSDILDYTAATTGDSQNLAKTRFILAVVGDVTIHPKASAPEVVKKVKENVTTGITYTGKGTTGSGDVGYNDIADYNIGDSVPFKLYGTLPASYAEYKQYYYKFTDTIDDAYFGTPTNVHVYVDGAEVTSGFTATPASTGLTVEFKNLKESATSAGEDTTRQANIVKGADGTAVTINKDSVITVTYDATLDSAAIIGRDGQRNKVDLTYSNNPNQEYGGTTDTSKTPEDGVIVFTYGVDINKVKPDETTKLPGAYFAIYKYDTDGTTKIYLKSTAAGKYDGTVTAPTETACTTSAGDGTDGIFKSDGTNLIKMEGLDAGTYYITELKQPEGYNKLEKDIKVVVTPTIKTDRQDWTYANTSAAAAEALTALEIKYDDADVATPTKDANASADTGKGTITIVNKEGNTLPSTGGMGTTLFVVGGGVTMAAAGIYLVSKKRSKDAE